MKRLAITITAIAALATSLPAFASGKLQGYAQIGGQTILTSLTGSSVSSLRLCPGAIITPKIGGVGATTYKDAALTQPNGATITANSRAEWAFYAADGEYTLAFSGCSTTWTINGLRISANSAISNVVNVATYGAVGDGKIVVDAAIGTGTALLTSAAGRFLSTDVGKIVRIEGAGVAGVALATTISGYTSAAQVTLAATASTTVTGKRAWWGTNDTAAIQAAVSALHYASAANNGSAVLEFGDAIGTPHSYTVNDTIDFGTDLQYAAIRGLGLPNVSGDYSAGTYYHGIEIRWTGADGTGKPIFWLKDRAYGNLIERLGFYGGDEAIRIRKVTSGSVSQSLARNKIHECQFDDQQVASIMWGFPTADTNVNQDDADGTEIVSCFFVRTLGKLGSAIIMNEYPGNGYLPIIDKIYTVLPGTVRHIQMRGFYNVQITNSAFHVSTAPDGTFAIDVNAPSAAPMGGWFKLINDHFELNYALTIGNWFSGIDLAPMVSLRDITLNYATACGGCIAIDLGNSTVQPYATLENVRVSNGAVQRTIRFGTRGALVNNGPSVGATPDLYSIPAGAIVNFVGQSRPAKFFIDGVLSSDTSIVGTNADLLEKTLWSYTLPAGSLDTNYQCVQIDVAGIFAGNANAKTVRLYWGASVFVLNPTTAAPNGVNWQGLYTVCRTGDSTQMFKGFATAGTVFQQTHNTTGATETLANSVLIKLTGQNGTATANDITKDHAIVRYLPFNP